MGARRQSNGRGFAAMVALCGAIFVAAGWVHVSHAGETGATQKKGAAKGEATGAAKGGEEASARVDPPTSDEPGAMYEHARAEYYELAEDAERRKVRGQWVEVADQLKAVIARAPESSHAAKARFTLGRLYRDVFGITKAKDDLRVAQRWLLEVAIFHAATTLADDALYNYAFIAARNLKEPEFARWALERITQEHKDSDMLRVVRRDLRKLGKGKARTPATFTKLVTKYEGEKKAREAAAVAEAARVAKGTAAKGAAGKTVAGKTVAGKNVAGKSVAGATVATSENPALVQTITTVAGEGETTTLVRIATSAVVQFRSATLPPREGVPARVFFDVWPAKLTAKSREPLTVSDGRIVQVRSGQFTKETARIVFELTAAHRVEAETVEEGAAVLVRVTGKPVQAVTATPVVATGEKVDGEKAVGEKAAGEKAVGEKAVDEKVAQEKLAQERVAQERRADAGDEAGKLVLEPAAAPVSQRDAILAALPKREPDPEPTIDATDATLIEEDLEHESAHAHMVEPPARDPRQEAEDLKQDLKRATRTTHKVKTICIDAGHGGHDTGAIGPTKKREKDVTLAIAKRLAEKLRKELKVKVVLTRESDRFVPLEERSRIADRHDADLFISIHADAHRKRSVGGITTYFLNDTDDRALKRVAMRENQTRISEMSDLNRILLDLALDTNTEDSLRLARHVQENMVERARGEHDNVRDLGVKSALFMVLIGKDIPSILVETSFISNPVEEKRLASRKYQDALIGGIVEGVRKYIRDTEQIAAK